MVPDLDEDASFVSPLESAATLGIAKTFRLYKPVMAMGSWLELQHWGRSFHSLQVMSYRFQLRMMNKIPMLPKCLPNCKVSLLKNS